MDNAVNVRVVDSDAEWDHLELDWSCLFRLATEPSAALRFDWLRTWWRVYGQVYGGEDGGLKLLTMWRRSSLVGVLPLYRMAARRLFGLRCIGFLSTGEAEYEETCPDYLNLLCLPGEESACLEAICATLGEWTWDQLRLVDLPDGSPLMHLDGRALRAGMVQTTSRGSCPVADLQGGLESYLGRLSANSRQQVRRLLREGGGAGAILELAHMHDWDQFFDDLVRLHQERWTSQGKPGCFASSRFTEFHRFLIEKWIPTGEAVLARLSVRGKPVACLYGFVTRSRFEFYQSGVRLQDDMLRSPGNLAHLMLMKRLLERGVTQYDFLRGAHTYKARLATACKPLVSICAWRRTVRSAVFRSHTRIRRMCAASVRALGYCPFKWRGMEKTG
jgi:hypothetical protein